MADERGADTWIYILSGGHFKISREAVAFLNISFWGKGWFDEGTKTYTKDTMNNGHKCIEANPLPEKVGKGDDVDLDISGCLFRNVQYPI
jgi:hypothetical protein